MQEEEDGRGLQGLVRQLEQQDGAGDLHEEIWGWSRTLNDALSLRYQRGLLGCIRRVLRTGMDGRGWSHRCGGDQPVWSDHTG